MSKINICGNLAQGDGLITLTSKAPVMPGPRTEATRESDNRKHRVHLENRCVPRTTLSSVHKNHKQSVNVGEVSANRYLPPYILTCFPFH
jgi:hypothetical protein